jgi:hypothetical protein
MMADLHPHHLQRKDHGQKQHGDADEVRRAMMRIAMILRAGRKLPR